MRQGHVPQRQHCRDSMHFSAHFTQSVYTEIAKVPYGKVISYGQLAMLSGHPGAARAVGQIAHFGPPHLPWHRLVHANGRLANGYVPGGPICQKETLLKEGVVFNRDLVVMRESQWL